MTTIEIVSVVIYAVVCVAFCIGAFFEEKHEDVGMWLGWAFLWPIGLALVIIGGPFMWAGSKFDTWRDGVLGRRREARWAREAAERKVRIATPLPTPPAPPPIDYRHAECSQCGHPIEERAAR